MAVSMMHELYINNTLVDVDDDFDIALLYDSMLFTGVSKLMSNRSTEFSLPKTANNLRAVELSHLSDIKDDPEAGMLYPRRNHKVDYYRNGILIVNNALGVMGDIEKRIPFVFVFGNMENTRRLNANMSELNEKDLDSILWDNDIRIMPYSQYEPGFAYMDFGQGAGIDGKQRYSHPTASVNWILDRMAESNGLTIDKGNLFDDMYIPLVSKTPSERSLMDSGMQGQLKMVAKKVDPVTFVNTINLEMPSPDNEDARLIIDNTGSARGFGFKGGLKGGYSRPVRVVINNGQPFLVTMHKQGEHKDFNLKIRRSSGGDIPIPGETIFSDSYTLIKRYTVDMTIDVSSVDYWVVRLYNSTTGSVSTDLFSLPDTVYAMTWIEDEEIPFNSWFPIIPNLPDMKQVDFLKSMMQLRGVFAYPKGIDTIGFASADDVLASRYVALDWTRKLITESPVPNAPEGLSFKMDNFAQKNWFRWSNDDEIESVGTDDYIKVYNETIEAEADVVELKFSASNDMAIGDEESGRPLAYVPVYTTENGSVKFNKLTPRVLMGRPGDNGRLELFFEGLSFDTILEQYYSGYRSIIEVPRVITVRVRLTDLDQAKLDMTRSVYFEQFGRYYAVLSVQAQSNGLCKCKMLELKQP